MNHAGNRVWFLFQALLIYICFQLHISTPLTSRNAVRSCCSHIWLISLSPSASVLRRAIYFTPNISRFFWLSYGQMMTMLGVREGISETSINRLSNGMPMLKNDEAKTWLPAKLQRAEILSEKMMRAGPSVSLGVMLVPARCPVELGC